MRSIVTITLLAGAALLSAAPAFAGADDGGTKSFWSGSSPAPGTTQNVDRRGQYRATYQAPANTADSAAPVAKDPPAFYHAMGTMSAQ